MKNVSLTLLAFHLRQRPTDPPHQVAPQADYLFNALYTKADNLPALKTLPNALLNYTDATYSPQLETDHTFWLSNGSLDLGSLPAPVPIVALLSPFRVTHDTYAIDLTLSSDPSLDLDWDQLATFSAQRFLFTDPPATFLGQILWFYAQIPLNTDPLAVANQCAAIFSGAPLTPSHQGQFLSQPIFEYHVSYAGTAYTLLISFNFNPKLLDGSYDLLLKWHGCRLKSRFMQRHVLQGSKGRDLGQRIRDKMSEASTLLQDPTHFNTAKDRILADCLQLALEYTQTLQELQAAATVHQTTLEHLRQTLTQLTRRQVLLPEYWHQDPEIADRERIQIQMELDYLQPAHHLLTQILQTMQHSVEPVPPQSTPAALPPSIPEPYPGLSFGILGPSLALGFLAMTCYQLTVEYPIQWIPSLQLAPHPATIAALLGIGVPLLTISLLRRV